MFYTKNSDKSRHKKVHILFQLKGDFKNNIVIGYKIERCKPSTIFKGKLDHYWIGLFIDCAYCSFLFSICQTSLPL